MPPYMKFAAFTVYETNYPPTEVHGGVLVMFAVLWRVPDTHPGGHHVRAATYRPVMVEALGHTTESGLHERFGTGAPPWVGRGHAAKLSS